MDLENFQPGPRVRNALIAAAIAFARSRLQGIALRNFENNVVAALGEGFDSFRAILETHFNLDQVRDVIQQGFGYFRTGNEQHAPGSQIETPPASADTSVNNPQPGSSAQIERPAEGGHEVMEQDPQRDSVLQRRRTADDAGLGEIEMEQGGDARAGGAGRAGGSTGGGGTGQLAPLCSDYRQFSQFNTNTFAKRTLLSMIAFKPIYKVSNAANKQGFYAHCCYVFIPNQEMWATNGVTEWMQGLHKAGHNVTWKNIKMSLKQINMTATFATSANSQGVVNSAPTSLVGHARGLEQRILVQNKIAEENADNSGLTGFRNGGVSWRQLENASSGAPIASNGVGTVTYGQASSNFQRYAQIAVTPIKLNNPPNSTSTFILDAESVMDIGAHFPLMSNIQASGTIFQSSIDQVQIGHQRVDDDMLFPIKGANNGSDFIMPGKCQQGVNVRPDGMAGKVINNKTTEENAYIGANERLFQGVIHDEGTNTTIKAVPNDYVHIIPTYGTNPTEIQPCVLYALFEASASLSMSIDLHNNRNYTYKTVVGGTQTSTKIFTNAIDQTVYKGIPNCSDAVGRNELISPLTRAV